MARRNITELSEIEFRGSLGEAFARYGEELESLGQRWAFEFELAAGDAEAAMASLHGQWWLLGLDVRVKAHRVAKRLKRASEAADGMGKQGAKFVRAYEKNFLNE
ncbi:hypothetical protein [Actinomadura rugatobispora]|uniref:Uncharacterized protein n=1 Tax=Actinomadura rugatobispora TaxID=1994 RepID=A0ABW0ZQQ3_9ACTN|nr:hypothetical protein GCM10010200_036760 [Actinomadura rugatobispora]